LSAENIFNELTKKYLHLPRFTRTSRNPWNSRLAIIARNLVSTYIILLF